MPFQQSTLILIQIIRMDSKVSSVKLNVMYTVELVFMIGPIYKLVVATWQQPQISGGNRQQIDSW